MTTEEEKEKKKKKEKEKEKEKKGRTWPEASQATASHRARLRNAFVKGHYLPLGEASEGGILPLRA